jgi:hypothetical protein
MALSGIDMLGIGTLIVIFSVWINLVVYENKNLHKYLLVENSLKSSVTTNFIIVLSYMEN